jgi:hypothetical protein
MRQMSALVRAMRCRREQARMRVLQRRPEHGLRTRRADRPQRAERVSAASLPARQLGARTSRRWRRRASAHLGRRGARLVQRLNPTAAWSNATRVESGTLERRGSSRQPCRRHVVGTATPDAARAVQLSMGWRRLSSSVAIAVSIASRPLRSSGSLSPLMIRRST